MLDLPVILLGSPNAGKTSIFNHLTGLNFKTVNYPGATVDYFEGTTSPSFGEKVRVIDTPGTYSLFPKSHDEQVTSSILFDGKTLGCVPSVVIAVVDATQLRRHLLVVEQAKQAGFSVIIALTMTDLLACQGLEIDANILAEALGVSCVVINGTNGDGVASLVRVAREKLVGSQGKVLRPQPWTMEQHFQFSAKVHRIFERSVRKTGMSSLRDPAKLTDKIDGFLLHPVMGLLGFVLIMGGVFTSIFWAAAPLMNFVDKVFTNMADYIVKIDSQSLFFDFLGNGIVASAGSVLVFVPQIAVLFLVIGVLEDSGYLARAATLVDRPLSKLGLNGRSFVPMLSGYACAIPAMMAARTISSRREKFITLFIAPLFSCSARLPVYALLLAYLFMGEAAWKPGVALALIYLFSLVLGLVAAALLNKILKKDESSFFMMELPFYRRPLLRSVLKGVWTRTFGYISRAAPVIFVFAVLMWAGTSFPRHNGEANLQGSYLAQAGRLIEPVMEPMGGDWRTGVSLISSFAAREVFVSSMAVMFNVAETEDEAARDASLTSLMKTAKGPDGRLLFSPSSIAGLIVFFMIALQCMATVGVARREFGSWRMPLLQLVLFNAVGYLLAVVVVQGLRMFGVS
jgi:ferrous iron transport protein B